MNRRNFLLLLPTLFICGSALAASNVATAESKLKKSIDEVLGVAQRSSGGKLAEQLRPTLTRAISFDAMTRRAVGPGWRKFSSGQRSEATKLFTTLIIRTYSAKLTPGETPKIKIKSASETAPGRVEVPTTLFYKGSDYNVAYRLEKAEGWKITDVVIEGVSLIANYRTQFDNEYKQGGADAVINALSQSVARP